MPDKISIHEFGSDLEVALQEFRRFYIEMSIKHGHRWPFERSNDEWIETFITWMGWDAETVEDV